MPASKEKQEELMARRQKVANLKTQRFTSRAIATLLGVSTATVVNDAWWLTRHPLEITGVLPPLHELLHVLATTSSRSTAKAIAQAEPVERLHGFCDGLAAMCQMFELPAVGLPSGFERLIARILGEPFRLPESNQSASDEVWKIFLHEIASGEIILPADEEGIRLLLAAQVHNHLDAGRNRHWVAVGCPARELSETINKMLSTLTVREERILRMRFGLGQPGHTQGEVGVEFRLSRERIRQIEVRALHKLRHPNRLNHLKALFQTLGGEIERLLAENEGLGTRCDLLSRALEADEDAKRELALRSVSAVLCREVRELELSFRSLNCLENAGIEFVGELVQWSEADLLKAKNFGRKSLKEVKEILAEMELALGMKESTIDQFNRWLQATHGRGPHLCKPRY